MFFIFSLIFGAMEARNIKKVYATSMRFTNLTKIKVNLIAETETFFIFLAHLKFAIKYIEEATFALFKMLHIKYYF